ncbi:serine carboxypeptidase-like 40 isoform X1 [Coffea eugenioides]|uniref:serine carboxypeptidase-like 40 isoform X1 n=1 Tax=Coffea eugenioides TaxID=49369 RepID=UPI000F61039E|nr:serine carboxypeptidase-like 40 isoform X1 [Coffea eugenioides]
MEIKKTQILLLSTLLLSSLALKILGKSHREARHQLFMAKLKPNSNIDKSHFTPFENPPEPMQDGLKEKDIIQKLPGQPSVSFKQYGGYITINATAGRAFYYYFTEAQDPKKAQDLPLLLWLNGGPGCSSLGYGAMQELGPFRVGSDGKTLYKNQYAWNHVANVLFLESPAGVGFSYSNTTSDFVKGGDRKTAADNYIFLINWLERFPEYKDRDFYIAGESYAGHYVPQLAHNIVYHNRKANKTIINLKGILIGNADINHETDNIGMIDYWASHALISLESSRKIHKYCNFSLDAQRSDECSSTLGEVSNMLEDIDIYNIYYPLCLDANVTSIPKRFSIMEIDPCSDNYVYSYFNLPEVQEAIHANVTKLHYDWQSCSGVIEHWEDRASTVLPSIEELMDNGIRVWLFSGDMDGRVPVTSTQYSLEVMNITTLNPWRAWYRDSEVGGYVQEYKDNLTFVTVRGAGHEVPSYRPDRALSLVLNFIAGTPLPKK